MRPMRIQRYSPNRSRQLQWGCGCALAGAFTALLAFTILYAFSPVLSGITAQFLGFTRISTTDTVFTNVIVPPTAVVQNPTSQQQVTVNLGQYGRETVSADQQNFSFITGNTEAGSPIARASFTEADLLLMCARQSAICQGNNDQFGNVSIDLRPNGAVVYADMNIGGVLRQRVGVVLQLDGSRTALNVVGIDINGGLYDYQALPPDLVGAVNNIVSVTNETLRQLAVEAGGENYSLSEIIIDDATLTLLLQ